MVSRAVQLHPHIKRRLEELGFPHVEITAEEKDSLNYIINEKKPDVLLMGAAFYQAATPYMTGELLERYPKLNVAVLSVHDYPDSLAACFIWHGVKSYVNLWEGYEEFHKGLQDVRQGKTYIAPNCRRRMEQAGEWPNAKTKITKRHQEILIFLCNGYYPENIGELMHITRRTVNTHLRDMYKMFHVKSREEMVAFAWGLDLVTKKDLRFIDRKEQEKPLPEWAAVRQRMNKAMSNGE
jgi:DNA-binding NarL/FixJ family response regulator